MIDANVLDEFNAVIARIQKKIKAKKEQKDTEDTITDEKD